MSKMPHAVFVPFPSQGHINPLLKLAKLLHFKGFYITFVNTEYNHKRLIKSKGSDYLENLPNFTFQTIPDGLPDSSETDATQSVPNLCRSTREHSLIPFQQLLANINSNSSVPPVSCIIADGVMAFTLQAAQELGIPYVHFWTFGASGFMSLKLCADAAEKGISPFKDSSYLTDGTLDRPVDWIPGLRNIQLKHIASFIHTTDPNDFMLEFTKGELEAATKASAIILYTFDAIEVEMLNILKPLFPPIYTIAPLQGLIDQIPDKTLQFLDCSLWKAEEQKYIEWLNSKEKNSVLYVNFGSIAVLTQDEMLELAWGIAESKKNFFWIMRPDSLKGYSSILLNEFLDETKERGLILGWCDQEKVLNQESVCGFLTHCGWNSTLEGITSGMSFLCRPCACEQEMNARFICNDLGIGIEIEKKWRRGEIDKAVRKLMDEEEGKEMKKRAMEFKKKAEEASSEHEGSSFLNLEKLVKEVLMPKF